MKLAIVTFLISTMTTAFASSAPSTCGDELNLYYDVVNLVNDDASKEMHLTEMAEITFVITEDHTIHVVQVLTKDYLLEFHIREKLEGAKVDSCIGTDHNYTILVNAKLA